MICSLLKDLIRKKGAINGPTAPTKIELNPATNPTGTKDLTIFTFFGPFKKRFHTINKPINGFKTSTLISFADCTSK